jgi:hypothetical protein
MVAIASIWDPFATKLIDPPMIAPTMKLIYSRRYPSHAVAEPPLM